MKKEILIVYYSHSGNTQKVAKLIQQETGGVLCEIQPEIAYPASYNAVVEQAKKEIQAGYRPEIKNTVPDLEPYDTIFVGSPNWWSTVAPPIATFLSKNNLSGKTIIPFCTHGGGGLGHIQQDINRLCPQSRVLDCFALYGDGGTGAKSKIAAWLRKIDI
ncbi:MAG TPA: flavodoxin [Thermoanaerobacterales bacterium]|nr:flavodoxin [Thermoanaerobacterales bacterium]